MDTLDAVLLSRAFDAIADQERRIAEIQRWQMYQVKHTPPRDIIQIETEHVATLRRNGIRNMTALISATGVLWLVAVAALVVKVPDSHPSLQMFVMMSPFVGGLGGCCAALMAFLTTTDFPKTTCCVMAEQILMQEHWKGGSE